jgi:hypothetical protein
MRSRLNAEGSAAWRGGDNDHWGEYLVTNIADGGTKLRLFMDADRYVLDIAYFRPRPGPLSLEEVEDFVRNKLLVLLEAREVEPHSGWE